jgi:hypothetical protein
MTTWDERVEALARLLNPRAFEKTSGMGHQEFAEDDREERETARAIARETLDQARNQERQRIQEALGPIKQILDLEIERCQELGDAWDTEADQIDVATPVDPRDRARFFHGQRDKLKEVRASLAALDTLDPSGEEADSRRFETLTGRELVEAARAELKHRGGSSGEQGEEKCVRCGGYGKARARGGDPGSLGYICEDCKGTGRTPATDTSKEER